LQWLAASSLSPSRPEEWRIMRGVAYGACRVACDVSGCEEWCMVRVV
jgi:hypothetical protein